MPAKQDDDSSANRPQPFVDSAAQRRHRQDLPLGYPDDLSFESQPDTGSLGVKGLSPVENRTPPWKLKGGR